ncbi:MAG: SURF1 family cytochrome oxidase biogenesis protein, partial [Luteimonas sp.]
MSRRRTLLLLWPLALLVIAAFCAAGVWQLGRMQQKQAMLDAVQRVLGQRRAQPLALAADAMRARDYDWAGGGGRFIDAPALLLDNQARDNRSGVRAYRVFQPDGANAAPLLVELGWLPLPGDRTLPDIARPPGTQRIAGLLAPPPSHGLLAAVVSAPRAGVLLTTGLDTPDV